MLLSHSHHFRLHGTMIFYDGHDEIGLPSENIVPLLHCYSYSYSWSQCHIFPLLVLPTATRLRLMKKTNPYHPYPQAFTQCENVLVQTDF